MGRRCLVGAVLAAGAMGVAPASASDCLPARVGADAASLPGPWRQALEALVAATSREGQPWSCPDAFITLVPPGDPGLAQLEVEDAAGARRRPVVSPADVVPLGEAMLARTFVLEAPAGHDWGDPHSLVPPVPLPPPDAEVHPGERPRAFPNEMPVAPAALLPPRHGPRLLADFLAGSRFTGPTLAMLMGAELRTSLAFERWSVGLMARYDTAIAYFQPVPDQFSLSSVSVGLTGGYAVLKAPVELTLAIEPSLGVLLMGSQMPGFSEPDIDTKVDLRLGGRLGAAVPVSDRIRAVCALGGEGVPEALFSSRHSRRRALPSLPGYMVGLSVGVELVAIQ